MPVSTVPRFEDPAFALDARDPSTEPIWGVAPQLNFGNDNGQLFVLSPSNEFIFANPATTLEQLITKSLITERLTYAAYNRDFGSDFWCVIGRGLSDLAIQSVCERYIREALSPIDLIRSVDQIATQVVGDTLYLSFRVIAISGYEQQFSFAKAIK